MRQLLASFFFLFAASAQADLIGVTWSGDVVEIDAATGAGSLIAPSGFSSLNSMATNSAGSIYSANAGLVTLDPLSGLGSAAANLGAIGDGTSIRGLAFSAADALYAINNGDGPGSIACCDDLYLIDANTGGSAFVGDTGFSGIQGLSFASDGVLYAWDIGAGLLTIDPFTGNTTDVNAVEGGTGAIQTLAFDEGGTLYGAGNALYTIDLASGAFVSVGSGDYSDVRGIAFIEGSPDPGVPTVPEPNTAVLIALGLAGLAGRRGRAN